MAALRTLADIEAAGAELARTWRKPTQEEMDRAFALYAPHLDRMTAAQAASHAA